MKNPDVFEGKSFQSLLKDIYENTEAKRDQIKTLMDSLASKINSPNDAAVIAPLIKDFLEVAVKNDDHLVKVATIVQRIISSETVTGTDTGFLTDEEKEELLALADKEAAEEEDAAIEDLADVVALSDDTEEIEEKGKAALEKLKR